MHDAEFDYYKMNWNAKCFQGNIYFACLQFSQRQRGRVQTLSIMIQLSHRKS